MTEKTSPVPAAAKPAAKAKPAPAAPPRSGAFRATAPMGATFGPGLKLRLTPAQSAARRHALAPGAKPDEWMTTGAVTFKRGEVFEVLDGELSKLAMSQLEPAAKAGTLNV